MTKIKKAVVVGALLALNACAYGGAAVSGNKIVILRNDSFLFGALRKVYVCQVSDAGLTGCQQSAEAP